jgi:hypothetical protein
MKCEICSQKIENIFLNKRLGTVIKDSKGKQHNICSACQSKLGNERNKILEVLGIE